MADLAPCRVCGHPVSEFAPACPQCGDPTAARYGHAKPPEQRSGIAKWILTGLLALVVYACVRGAGTRSSSVAADSTSSAETPTAPAHVVHVVSVECTSMAGRNRGDITINNTGFTTIPFAKVFMEFKDKAGSVISAQDSYFSPHDIPPGATASATVYGSAGAAEAATCGPSAIQDTDGNPVSLQ